MQLKRCHKDWKWNLIREQNPELIDLASDWFTEKEVREYCEALRDAESSSA